MSGLENAGISADNIAFGMGGGLLQQVNRDTLKYAMKCSAIQDEHGVWHDVYKDPIEGAKTSKKGRLGLVYDNAFGADTYHTVPRDIANNRCNNLLSPVFRNGEILRTFTMNEIRARAEVKPKTKEMITRYE